VIVTPPDSPGILMSLRRGLKFLALFLALLVLGLIMFGLGAGPGIVILDGQPIIASPLPSPPSVMGMRYFTATLISPDERITLPVDCRQLSSTDGPKCFALFPNGAKMEVFYRLPDKDGIVRTYTDWSADNRFAVSCEDFYHDTPCTAHGVWNVVEGTRLDLWLPWSTITWWSPTGHTLAFVRDIMVSPLDWGLVDAEMGELSRPQECPDWLLSYKGREGTAEAWRARSLCAKVAQLTPDP
jgi:hypothetical protein